MKYNPTRVKIPDSDDLNKTFHLQYNDFDVPKFPSEL